jgi:D-3-phosphoglycerate dehydrogenase
MHEDKPKMIGQVGMILGDYDVNIAGMQVDREEIGGNALMILTIDQEVAPVVMDKIKKLPGIRKATYVGFKE